MHLTRLERKIERAHQRVLKANERLAKLQAKLANAPPGPRTSERHRDNPWVITAILGTIGWSGFPWQKALDFIERAIPAGTRLSPVSQPQRQTSSTPQTIAAFPLPQGKVFNGVVKIFTTLESAVSKIESRFNAEQSAPTAPLPQPINSPAPSVPIPATSGEFWTFGRRTRGG